jgi:hypothetical protein
MWSNKIRYVQSPQLFSYAVRSNITVAEASLQDNLYDILQTPLSAEAYQRYMNLVQDLRDLLQTQDNDTWSYIWGQELTHLKRPTRLSQEHFQLIQFLNYFGKQSVTEA